MLHWKNTENVRRKKQKDSNDPCLEKGFIEILRVWKVDSVGLNENHWKQYYKESFEKVDLWIPMS